MALGKNLIKKSEKKHNPDHEGDTSAIEVPASDEGRKSEPDKEKSEQKSFHQFCVFKSGDEKYALPINLVKEVVLLPKIAPVSQMPAYICGMANIRGNIYGVLDLKQFFNTYSGLATENKYLLVLEHEVFQMGIAIPEVPDTLIVSEDMIEGLSISLLKSEIGQKYLKGIIKKDCRVIILFDILGMISSDKFTEIS